MTIALTTGMDNLLARHKGWLKGRRVGLLSHAAAVDSRGQHSVELLTRAGVALAALFGPEHGFSSLAAPGEKVASSRHQKLNIPIYSLYGASRKPLPEILQGLDTVIIDLQNLAARPYTYLATMMNTMEAAAENGLDIIVTDRPVPLPNTVDGPPLNKRLTSFVAPANLPMAYGKKYK